jgi:excisionase family DNA binding protein
MPSGARNLVTVKEAAALLRVSPSTIWRWIESGRLEAYRVGPKRVFIDRSDVIALITPVRPDDAIITDLEDLHRQMTEEERERLRIWIEDMKKIHAEMLAERGGKPFSDSTELINEARDERSAALNEAAFGDRS